jgi:predicted dehydrogenase
MVSFPAVGPRAEEGARRPVGIGLIGAGMVGQLAHLANFIQSPGCRVTALAELRPELGRRVAARFGVPRVYGDHRALLDDPDIDAVVVVTRRPATGPIVLDALKAGRHVLSEKPMAHTAAQARLLADTAGRGGLRYAVGYMKRHDAGYACFKTTFDRLRESGELGDLVFLRGYCLGGAFACNADGFEMTDEPRPEGLETWPIAPDWLPPEHAEDYAWFLNVFIHDLNILRNLVGREPEVSFVDFSRRNGRLVAFDWGAFPGVLEMAETPFDDWREGVEAVFERGRLTLRFPPPLLKNVPGQVELERTQTGETQVKSAVPWSWAFRRQADAFIIDVAEGREPSASGADAVADIALAEKIFRRALDDGRLPGRRRS